MIFSIRERIRSIYLKEEKGQMLLFVMIILLLLLIIILAIIVNVRVDLKETQMEREYERGYSIAEEELFDISSEGYDMDNYDDLSREERDKFCPSDDECEGGSWTCGKKVGVGEEGESDVIVKRCVHHGIFDMTIEQDQTLEAYVNGASRDLELTWDGAPAMSIMLVCKDSASGEYTNVRASVCRGSAGNCGITADGFISIDIAKDENNVDYDAPLDMSNGCPGIYKPELLRLRAIGGEATAVTLTGDLPQQMEEVRVQSFTEGISDAKGLSAPEVVTFSMIRKRLPSIFDYVLFVANGDVSK